MSLKVYFITYIINRNIVVIGGRFYIQHGMESRFTTFRVI